MADIVTITDVNKNWKARRGADNLVRFAFKTTLGAAFDISSYTFSWNLRNFNTSTNLVSLSQSSGLTNGGATGYLDYILTSAQTLTQKANNYLWLMFVVNPSGNTLGVFNGTFELVSELYTGDITTEIEGTINLSGITVNVTVTLTGGSSGSAGVTTFNGRSGAVTPAQADYDSFYLTPTEGDAAYQPKDSDLTAIAALTTTAYGRAFLALADAAAALTAIGAQPLDSDLTAIAALATTAFGRSLLTASDAAAARVLTLAMASLSPTALKTTNYSAAANELVRVDTTSGVVAVTFPTAPADKTLLAVKHVVRGGTNTVTLTLGGSDKFNVAGGSASGTLTLANQAIICQYESSTSLWHVLADDLSLGQLDLRFQPLSRYPFTIYKNTTLPSLTGTTNETVMDFITVTGSSWGATDIHRIYSEGTKVGANSSLTIRLRVGPNLPTAGSTVPSGTTVIALFVSVAGNLHMPFKRNLYFLTLGSQLIYPVATTALTDDAVVNTALAALSLDFTTLQYVMVTYQLGSAADAATMRTFEDIATR